MQTLFIFWLINGVINLAISAIFFSDEKRFGMFLWWFISGLIANTISLYLLIYPKGMNSKIMTDWIDFCGWIEDKFFR